MGNIKYNIAVYPDNKKYRTGSLQSCLYNIWFVLFQDNIKNHLCDNLNYPVSISTMYSENKYNFKFDYLGTYYYINYITGQRFSERAVTAELTISVRNKLFPYYHSDSSHKLFFESIDHIIDNFNFIKFSNNNKKGFITIDFHTTSGPGIALSKQGGHYEATLSEGRRKIVSDLKYPKFLQNILASKNYISVSEFNDLFNL